MIKPYIPTLLFFTFILFNCISIISGCKISGKQIGKCIKKSQINPDSFCYDYIADYICVPQDRPTWSSYDQTYRDELIQDIFMKNLEQKFVQEYQDPWTSNIVSNNLQCYYSYRKFICSWNFPTCSVDTGVSIVLCKTICEDFFSNCQGNIEICEVSYENKDLGLNPSC